MSWRLPSGKALAEFWLQAGFLAPLMLGTPSFRKRKKAAPAASGEGMQAGMGQTAREVPERSGNFRETR